MTSQSRGPVYMREKMASVEELFFSSGLGMPHITNTLCFFSRIIATRRWKPSKENSVTVQEMFGSNRCAASVTSAVPSDPGSCLTWQALKCPLTETSRSVSSLRVKVTTVPRRYRWQSETVHPTTDGRQRPCSGSTFSHYMGSKLSSSISSKHDPRGQ